MIINNRTAPVTQLAEWRTFNPMVVGSIPTGRTMNKTLNIDNPHAMDMEVFNAAIMEALPSKFYSRLRHTIEETCPWCKFTFTESIEISGLTRLEMNELDILSVKAAKLAGWDGKSGCWGRHKNLIELYGSI